MSALMIEDLQTSEVLDHQAMVATCGGANTVGLGAGLGGITSSNGNAGGGINLFSPQIIVSTNINVPVSIQLATVLEQIQTIDTTTILNSVLSGLPTNLLSS